MNCSTSKARRDIRRFKRFKNANHPHARKQARKAASSAPSPRKRATTHKHAGSKATNPQTLFRALCLPRGIFMLGGSMPGSFLKYFARLTFSRAVVLVYACIVHVWHLLLV